MPCSGLLTAAETERTVIIKDVIPFVGLPQPPKLSPQKKALLMKSMPKEIPGISASGGPLFISADASGGTLNPPPYEWRHGCGPTAAGMVIAYWDAQGFVDLIPGDGSTQTDNANNMMANSEHYIDYALPLDDDTELFPTVLADESELGGAHISNCLADFIHTSWSLDNLRYGWSTLYPNNDSSRGMSGGMALYTTFANDKYLPTVSSEYWAQNINTFNNGWNKYKLEINTKRPVILGVDSNADGVNDHFVCGIGYSELDGTKKYICYDTWDTGMHTYNFVPIKYGVEFGVGYAAFYRVTAAATYTISGTIIDSTGPLAGVAVTVDTTTVTTDANGVYTVSNLYPGTHPVTPVLAKYAFTAQNIILPPSTTAVNFTATYAGDFHHYEIALTSGTIYPGVPAGFRIRAINELGLVMPGCNDTVNIHVNSGEIDVSSVTLVNGEADVNITLTDSASTVNFWVDSGGIASSQITVSVAIPVAKNLTTVRVFPNPCSAQDTLEFSPLSAKTAVKIFTIDGKLVKELNSTTSAVTWNLKNDNGENAAPGIYLYLLKDDAGSLKKGKFALIR
ncbi:MAG: T9SS type A sorting domain-containing protein [Elusimicrobiota bacterium]